MNNNLTAQALDDRRLVTRVRMKYLWNSPAALFNPLVEFGDLPVMRKCLLGIKERAEKMA